VFLTTHYIEEAELLADTVAIISKGSIVAIGSPSELIERNANYMCLTLKSVDAVIMDTIRKCDSNQFRTNTTTSRSGDTDDVLEIPAHQGRGLSLHA
jgi:ABC-2 type transport system ATP-binding protein